MRYFYTKFEGETRPYTALQLSQEEWNAMQENLSASRRQQEQNEAKALREQEKRERSRKMTENWPNTLTNMQKEREKRLLDAAQNEESIRIQEYNDILKEREKSKQEILEKAKKMINERKESSRQITSGLILSAVLGERRKQIAHKKEIQQQQKIKLLAELAGRKKVQEEYEEELQRQKINVIEKKRRNKQILDEQMKEIVQNKQREIEEKIQEKEDLTYLRRELAQSAEKEKQESQKRKEKLKEEQEQWAAVEAQYKMLRRQQEEDEDNMNAVYLSVKEKLDKKRVEIEKKLREQLLERRAKVQLSLKPKSEYSLQEDDLPEKIRKEQVEREQKKERLCRELKQFQEEAKLKAQAEAKKLCELKRYEMLLRLKLEECNKIWKEAQVEKEKAKQRNLRDILLQQWEERDKKRKEEAWENMAAYQKEQKQEEEALMQYCDDIQKTAADGQLPMYPVLSAIARVKKSAGFNNEGKKVKFLESRIPIESVSKYAICQQSS